MKYKKTKLSNMEKQQIYAYYDKHKKQQKQEKHITTFGDVLGTLHFWY